MTYRVRSWSPPDGLVPLPGLDIATGSRRVAAQEALDLATEYGRGEGPAWDEVSVQIEGQRAVKGAELESWVRATEGVRWRK